MTYTQIIILNAPPSNSSKLAGFVAQCIKDGVRLVCVVGPECERVHDVIDELIVGDGSTQAGYEIVTTWHAGESIAKVKEFAELYATANAIPNVVQEVLL